MKKTGLKITSKVLTGLVLLTGITAIPTNAVEVNNAAVDVNEKDVKVSVYESNGHYYAKLTTTKEVANVVARVVVDGKAEFTIKRDLIKVGEVVEYELDINAPVPAKVLPKTSAKRETIKVSQKVNDHKFDIIVKYDVATDEVKEKQEKKAQEAADKKAQTAAEETKPATTTETKKEEPKTESEAKPATTEEVKPAVTAEQPAATPVSATAEVKPTILAAVPEAPKPAVPTTTATTAKAGTSTFYKAPANAQRATKQTTTATTKTTTTTNTNTATKAAATQPVATTQLATTPLSGTREEQIKQAFINKVNQLRSLNGLTQLSQNAQLNNSTKARASVVIGNKLTAAVHGVKGSLEKGAAAQAGYPGAQHILYNVAINTNSGTPDQVAQRLIDSLYHEINNVTTAFPYGHRNTLLNKNSTELGVGIVISGNRVALVHHQNNSGAFQGKTPISSVYLDGKRY